METVEQTKQQTKQNLITQKFVGLPRQIGGIAIGRKGSIGKGLTSGKLGGIKLKNYNVVKTEYGLEIVIVGTPFNILKAEKWLLVNITRWVQKALGDTYCLWCLNPETKAFVLQVQGPPPIYKIPVAPIPMIESENTDQEETSQFRPCSPKYAPPTKSSKSSLSMPSSPNVTENLTRSVSV